MKTFKRFFFLMFLVIIFSLITAFISASGTRKRYRPIYEGEIIAVKASAYYTLVLKPEKTE